jgi:hypothetical protein
MNNIFNTYYTIEPLKPDNTSWQPEAVVNNKIRSESNITSNWGYRQYIQKNANQIMKYNTMEAIYASGNNPYTMRIILLKKNQRKNALINLEKNKLTTSFLSFSLILTISIRNIFNSK